MVSRLRNTLVVTQYMAIMTKSDVKMIIEQKVDIQLTKQIELAQEKYQRRKYGKYVGICKVVYFRHRTEKKKSIKRIFTKLEYEINVYVIIARFCIGNFV
jgi:hypothetical protein